MRALPANSSFAAIMLLMFVAGIGIPVMAVLNSGLGQRIGSPAAATTILFGLGFLVAGSAMLLSGTVPSAIKFAGVPPQFFFGAVFVVFYILSITWAAPRIGLGNAIFFVLLGQLVAAAGIDHFGLFGAIKAELTARRLAGLAIMAVGVYFARRVT